MEVLRDTQPSIRRWDQSYKKRCQYWQEETVGDTTAEGKKTLLVERGF